MYTDLDEWEWLVLQSTTPGGKYQQMTQFQVEVMIFKWRYIVPAQEFRIGSIPLFAADTMWTFVHFLENLCCSSGEGPKQVQHTLHEGEVATNTPKAEW